MWWDEERNRETKREMVVMSDNRTKDICMIDGFCFLKKS